MAHPRSKHETVGHSITPTDPPSLQTQDGEPFYNTHRPTLAANVSQWVLFTLWQHPWTHPRFKRKSVGRSYSMTHPQTHPRSKHESVGCFAWHWTHPHPKSESVGRSLYQWWYGTQNGPKHASYGLGMSFIYSFMFFINQNLFTVYIVIIFIFILIF